MSNENQTILKGVNVKKKYLKTLGHLAVSNDMTLKKYLEKIIEDTAIVNQDIFNNDKI